MDDALLHRNTLYAVCPILRFPGEHQELRRCVCCRGKVEFRTFFHHGRGPRPGSAISIVVAPGRLGLTISVRPGSFRGAMIDAINTVCPFRDEVSVGDTIVAINGKEVTTSADLSERVRETRKLLIIRGVRWNHIIQCACSSCVYCSEKCRHDDRLEHGARCDAIVKTFATIHAQAPLLIDAVDDFIRPFVGLVDSPDGDILDNSYEYDYGERSKSCWKNYFLLRQQLIEQLINEGIARTDGNGKMKQNDLALDIATFYCQQLFNIDKYDSYYSHVAGLIPRKEILMNLYLFTGKYQDLYDICCYYASKGEQTYHTPYHQDLKFINKEDISKPFFYGNMRNIHHASFPAVALNHMYLLKKMMHENVEALRLINCQFLNSYDCISTIGEFLGINREWIIFETNWYKNQALEIMQQFIGCKVSEAEFGKLHGHSELFLSSSNFHKQMTDFSLLDITKVASAPLYSDHLLRQSNITLWEETLVSYVKDYQCCLQEILPCLEDAVDRLNDMAGYDALSRSIADNWGWKGHIDESHCPQFIITRFIRDAMEICLQNFLEFDDFFRYYEELRRNFMAILVLERRMAQAFYYISLSSGSADAVLKKLSEGSKFRRIRPPPMNQNELIFLQELKPGDGVDGVYVNKIHSISRYLSDVTDVIDALFNADLATDENLTILFGDSSIVSNTTFDLQVAKLEANQKKLVDFWPKKRRRITKV